MCVGTSNLSVVAQWQRLCVNAAVVGYISINGSCFYFCIINKNLIKFIFFHVVLYKQ